MNSLIKDSAEVYKNSFFSFLFFKNHYAPVGQVNWHNMTFLQLAISSPLIHALGDPSQTPLRFEPGSPDWEAYDLPTELSLPPKNYKNSW